MNYQLHHSLKFVIPAGIWCWLFQPFFFNQAVISSETLHIYSVVKFYLDNLKAGIFPLWDPYNMWGTPTQIFLNYVGIFNPLWLITLLLNTIGITFYHSFLYSLILYFWLGQLGFYLLAKLILRDSRAAYFSFLLFLFSSTSLTVFSQSHSSLIYIPSLWFFYFFFSFLQKPSRYACTGLTLSSCLILTSYLPFYFLTVLILIGTLTSLFYYSQLKTIVLRIAPFIRKNLLLTIVLLASLLLAFIPGYRAYQNTVNKEIVAPFRNVDIGKKTGVDFSEYTQVSNNGFSSRMDFNDLYSNLDAIQYGDDCFFYISIFFYLLLLMGTGVRIHRKILIGCLTAIPLFFLILTKGSPFHRFIFDHVVYFKLIRNMHFFLPFFLAVLILVAAEIFKDLLVRIPILSRSKRRLFIFATIFIHCAVFIFLMGQDSVILSSFIAIGLSLIFWLFLTSGQSSSHTVVFSILLLSCIIIQPMDVLWRHNQRALYSSSYTNKALIAECLKAGSVKPHFTYTRPTSPRKIGNDDIAKSRITMTDSSRFFATGFPTYWAYDLNLKAPFDLIQEYTRYKFYVHHAVENFEGIQDWGNPVLAANEAEKIEGPSNQFYVMGFDVNSIHIHTNYPQKKFLVYTDNYDLSWKATVNKIPRKIYRVNTSFKGIVVPAGPQDVIFHFQPGGVRGTSLMLIFLFLTLLLSTLWFSYQECIQKNKVKI